MINFILILLHRVVLIGVIVVMSLMNVFAEDDNESKRRKMVAEIEDMVKRTESYTGRNTLDKRVVEAMLAVPRHEFVPAENQAHAYKNSALPLSHKQTISQPYIVALMTDLAGVASESMVLEVGTGSGYQAAVLSEIVSHVYSIEIVEALGLEAEARLQELGYSNVKVKVGDGYYGWDTYAPYDAILVTAAAEHIPEELLQQLKSGGRLVIPVGEQGKTQSLRVLTKGSNGEIEKRDVLPVAFVPLTGKH